MGVPDDKLVIDPTVSGIGYGIEYAYSAMERMRIAALTQQDTKLQFPIICNIARETWKTKEARISEKENPKMGDAKKAGHFTGSNVGDAFTDGGGRYFSNETSGRVRLW